MEKNELITVECAYASIDQTFLLTLRVKLGSTIEEVIDTSGLLRHCPELVLNNINVGIFSQQKNLQDCVKAGDRVEIYRSLLIDPMSARRRRAPPPKRRKF